MPRCPKNLLTISSHQFSSRHMKRCFSNSFMAASSKEKLVEHWLKGRGIYNIPVGLLPLSFVMAPHKKHQASTASSLSSRTSAPAPKPKRTGKAQKPVEAVLKPVKRLKTALSTASSQADSNDVPENISDDASTPDINIVSDAEDDTAAEEDAADEVSPEEQLSTCPSPKSTHPPDLFSSRGSTEDLAFPHLQLLQIQRLRSL
jgi:hypothetical protein